MSHGVQSGGSRSPFSTLISLTPVTQTIARGGNYCTNIVAVEASGEVYKRALLTSNFLTALKPSLSCIMSANPFYESTDI